MCPRPPITLVQAYDTPVGEIWHCDLYRLTAVEEIEELGLTEAFDTAFVWSNGPKNWVLLTPDTALNTEL